MNEIYCIIWGITKRMNDKTKIRKKPLFLFLSILFWSLAGMSLYLLISVLMPVVYSAGMMFVAGGYFGIVMGFFGAVMYTFRNTEPEDFE